MTSRRFAVPADLGNEPATTCYVLSGWKAGESDRVDLLAGTEPAGLADDDHPAAGLFEADERQVLLDILADPALTAGRNGQVIIGDKNYYGRDFEAILASAGPSLLRPARKGEAQRPGTEFFRPLRQIIESIIFLQGSPSCRMTLRQMPGGGLLQHS